MKNQIEYYKIFDLKNLSYLDDSGVLITEKWETIKDYENYQVSTFGRFKSLNFHREKRESILKQDRGKFDYLRVAIFKNGKRNTFLSHRLVAIAFIPNPENKPEVNHIGKYPDGREGNKLDNRVISLTWSTKIENVRHSFDNNLQNIQKGEKCYNSKLTEEQVLEIRKIGKTQTLLKTGEQFGVSFQLISDIIHLKRWKHVK